MARSTASGCHTCRRQRLRCDGAKPTCNKCAVRGAECLGYGVQPILWVQPKTQSQAPPSTEEGDAVARRPGRKRGRPRLVLMESNDKQAKGKTFGLQLRQFRHYGQLPLLKADEVDLRLRMTPNLDPAGYRRQRLMLDCLQYYNDEICPEFVLFDSPSNPHRFPIELWHYLPDMMLNIAISTSLVHQIIKSKAGQGLFKYRAAQEGGSGTISVRRDHLGTFRHPSLPTIYKSQLKTITMLNEDLGDSELKYGDFVLVVITTLMRVEIQQSAFGPWPAHLEAARAIIAHRGGFSKLALENGIALEDALPTFMLVDVMNSVMTPTSKLDARTTRQLEYIKHLPTRHKDGLYCGFPCPNDVLGILIRINHTRYLSTTSTSGEDDIDAAAEDLIRRIANFSPSSWAEQKFEDLVMPQQWSSNSSVTGHAAAYKNIHPSVDGVDEDEEIQLVTRTPISPTPDSLQETWEDLAKAFQAAVLLYCLQTLFLGRAGADIPGIVATSTNGDGLSDTVTTSVEAVREMALDMLLGALRRLWARETKEVGWCGKFTHWPMFIAGMELEGTRFANKREKTFLCESLSKLVYHLGDLSPLDAVAVLETVWGDGEGIRELDGGRISWIDRLDMLGIRGVFFF